MEILVLFLAAGAIGLGDQIRRDRRRRRTDYPAKR
jgi:hypothetical protein